MGKNLEGLLEDLENLAGEKDGIARKRFDGFYNVQEGYETLVGFIKEAEEFIKKADALKRNGKIPVFLDKKLTTIGRVKMAKECIKEMAPIIKKYDSLVLDLDDE